jgi:hypothetical protein
MARRAGAAAQGRFLVRTDFLSAEIGIIVRIPGFDKKMGEKTPTCETKKRIVIYPIRYVTVTVAVTVISPGWIGVEAPPTELSLFA